QPLGLGGLDGLEGRQRRDRVFEVGRLPHLPARLRLEGADDRDLGVERALRRRAAVEQLEREAAQVEIDPVIQAEAAPGLTKSVHAEMRPRTGDVAVDDERAGCHVEHGAYLPSGSQALAPAALLPLGPLLLPGPA